MSKQTNKQRMQHILAEMGKVNLDSFVDIMSDDMNWSWMGTELATKAFEVDNQT